MVFYLAPWASELYQIMAVIVIANKAFIFSMVALRPVDSEWALPSLVDFDATSANTDRCSAPGFLSLSLALTLRPFFLLLQPRRPQAFTKRLLTLLHDHILGCLDVQWQF